MERAGPRDPRPRPCVVRSKGEYGFGIIRCGHPFDLALASLVLFERPQLGTVVAAGEPASRRSKPPSLRPCCSARHLNELERNPPRKGSRPSRVVAHPIGMPVRNPILR